ncbi:MAG: DUF6328 family protein [Actinomycetota bacterium]
MAEGSRQDRELIELLNELRVVLPGVQVLFAFLLTVPFTQYFPKTTPGQQRIYFAALLLTAVATAFLISPTAFHRIRWRDRDKEHLLKVSNKFALIGLVLLAGALTCVVWLITDVIYGSPWTTIVTVASAVLFGALWFLVPLLREATRS